MTSAPLRNLTVEAYNTRPKYNEKFCPLVARNIIKGFVEDILQESSYSSDIA